ncbi:hypothetical protein ONZ45_g15387 [Pleurotus djamor]|nr:hypothetical protein ONZ45_g15387 [Pleurotus djamor]
MTDVHHRLETAETEFIQSVAAGIDSLECFEQSWTNFVTKLNTQPMDAATSNLAHFTAGRVHNLASQFLDMHKEGAQMRASLLTDFESIFEQLRLDDEDGIPSQALSCPESESPSYPPYIAPAYKWLLDNIHNPYPSKAKKSSISRETSTSVHNIDTWFLNVRRRIGWTSICKTYFSGSRTDTVAAATRALVVEDEHGVIASGDSPPANIRMAFVEMEAAARELYSDRFTKSALAGRLDGIVKDMTGKDKKRRRQGKPRVKEQSGSKTSEKKPADEAALEPRRASPPRLPSPAVANVRPAGKRRAPVDDDDFAAEVSQPRKRSSLVRFQLMQFNIFAHLLLVFTLFEPS